MVSSSLMHRPPRQTFIAKAYRLGPALPPLDSPLAQSKMVLISSNADGVTNPSYARASDLSVVVLLKKGRLALLRLGGSHGEDWKWNTSFCVNTFSDIATYKGQLCAVDTYGTAFLTDSNSLKMTHVADKTLDNCYLRLNYQLIDACGELYLACMERGTIADHITVYRLSFRLEEWVEIADLGSQAFVLCASFNISIPRDAFSVNHENRNRRMKNNQMGSPSLLFSYDQEDKDGSDNGYCYIRFNTRHYPTTMPGYFHVAS